MVSVQTMEGSQDAWVLSWNTQNHCVGKSKKRYGGNQQFLAMDQQVVGNFHPMSHTKGRICGPPGLRGGTGAYFNVSEFGWMEQTHFLAVEPVQKAVLACCIQHAGKWARNPLQGWPCLSH